MKSNAPSQALPLAPLSPARSTPLGAPLLRSDPASGPSGVTATPKENSIPHFLKGG